MTQRIGLLTSHELKLYSLLHECLQLLFADETYYLSTQIFNRLVAFAPVFIVHFCRRHSVVPMCFDCNAVFIDDSFAPLF